MITTETRHATIVLVHGAWHGPWCWDPVSARLEAAGVRHVAVDLPLDGHQGDVDAVRKTLDDLEGPKVVVGHSYGGLVMSGAVEGREDVDHLVYVCAFMLDEGAQVLDQLAHLEPTPLFDALKSTPDGRSAIEPAKAPGVFYNACPPDVAAASAARLRSMDPNSTRHPCLGAPWRSIGSTYVLCTRDQAISAEAQRIMATGRARSIVELDTDHSPFLSRTDELAELLVATVAPSESYTTTPGGDAARTLWRQGDYTAVGTRIASMAEDLCEFADVRGGMRVLDVATGHGNVAICAARREATVTGIDIVPGLVDVASRRLAADGLEADVRVGNAEALDVPDDSFDVVLSCVGVQFTVDQRAAARELRRVCKPGGRIALACWTPLDLWSELPAIQARHLPPPPGAPSPMTWGTEAGLRDLFGDNVEMAFAPRTFRYRCRTPQSYVDMMTRTFPPFVALHERVDDETADSFDAELLDMAKRWNEVDDGSLVLPLTYHLVTIEGDV